MFIKNIHFPFYLRIHSFFMKIQPSVALGSGIILKVTTASSIKTEESWDFIKLYQETLLFSFNAQSK